MENKKIKKFKDGVLVNSTALESLKGVPDNVFHSIITSPPFNTSKRTGASDAYNKRYDKHLDNMSPEQYLDWTIEHFKEFEGVLKKDGTILYNLSYGTESHEFSNLIFQAIAKIYEDTEFCVADTIIWKKNSAIPNNVSHNKITRIAEFVFVIVRKSEYKTFKANKVVKSTSKTGQKFYENVFNFLEARNNDGSNKLNKATYSTDLVEELLKRYCKEGSLIRDPFHGTGTTANACIRSGMGFMGIELSKEQHEFAIQRLQETYKEIGDF